MYRHPLIDRDKVTPRQALDILIEGNQRFKNNVQREHDMLSVRDVIKEKQHPFASVLGCSDSRTTVELIFDQNLGDIFSVRLAGNIASIKAIGSLEFSCKYLGSKLVVVMGHSNCGAIKAACDHYKGGNIGAPVGKLSFSDDKLVENILAFLTYLRTLKPAASKGVFIRSITISATMSPGIHVQV